MKVVVGLNLGVKNVLKDATIQPQRSILVARWVLVCGTVKKNALNIPIGLSVNLHENTKSVYR
jgi:hypothetical protein